VSKIVLCVDDSATMQQVADITFRGTEYTYVGARSHDVGLDRARSQNPTLILADSQMPGQGKSGYDLCLALKSDPATSNIPVVILIGNAAPYDTARGVQVGADASLPKPWDTQTMLEKITEILGKAAAGVAKPGHAPTGAPVPAAPVVAPAAASKAPPAAPPRSATIMGMPTIKMPAGNAGPATPLILATPVGPARTTVMAVPPISPGNSGPGTSPAIRSPAPPPPAPVVVATPTLTTPTVTTPTLATPTLATPTLATPTTAHVVSRAPMVSGTPTKRSLLVEHMLAKMAAQLAEAVGLAPGSPELLALLKLSTEVIERIVWEVVPDLAEQIIRENLHDLTARRS
jgi:CheY-like chemotaxis protein